MTLAEQMIQRGYERGYERSFQMGLCEAVLAVVEEKFGPVPPDLTQQIGALVTQENLRKILKSATKACSLDEVRMALGEETWLDVTSGG